MLIGKVEFIYITAKKGDPTIPVEQIHAVPGKGLEGDRYFDETSTGLKRPGTGHEITLIELEAIEAMQQENGIPITPDQTRRNIVTRGVPLNDLVGHEFSIGDIHLRGIRLCEPCQYLAKRIDQRILSAMAHRGGLRADILTDGIIHVHDLIKIGN
jgi:MOSC domain-containing protein YiiM